MKKEKIKVQWSETHFFEAEFLIPKTLDHKVATDYIFSRIEEYDRGEPIDIDLDWDDVIIKKKSQISP